MTQLYEIKVNLSENQKRIFLELFVRERQLFLD